MSVKRPYKDERDKEIQTKSESHALSFMTAATQILTVICLFKGNPAWKGGLALLFIGAATALLYKYRKYEEKPYLYVGMVLGAIGAVLMVWFGITG